MPTMNLKLILHYPLLRISSALGVIFVWVTCYFSIMEHIKLGKVAVKSKENGVHRSNPSSATCRMWDFSALSWLSDWLLKCVARAQNTVVTKVLAVTVSKPALAPQVAPVLMLCSAHRCTRSMRPWRCWSPTHACPPTSMWHGPPRSWRAPATSTPSSHGPMGTCTA